MTTHDLASHRISTLLAAGLCLVWSVSTLRAATEEHENTEHAHSNSDCPAHEEQEHEEHGNADEPAGHDEEDAHDGHEEEGLRLSDEQRHRFGIVVQVAGPGSIKNELSLPGQIVFNEDKVAHLVPRSAGIVADVRTSVGDLVASGDTLAVIDSIGLAEAKMTYVAAATELGCCQFELPRAQAIHDNTLKLLELLAPSPSLEKIATANIGEMGVYRSLLVSAYAEYVLTRKAYAREQILMQRKISSEGDFLAAENAFEKARAEYAATRDTVAFKVKQDLLDATRDRQLGEFELAAARQKLRVLGLSDDDIAPLSTAVTTETVTTHPTAHECTDPHCTDCGSTAAPAQSADSKLGWYALRAPFDGVIVQKHISLGERVEEDSDVFTIVDTRSVWVHLTVYAKHLGVVKAGQPVTLRGDDTGAQVRGEIAMVTPFVEDATRSATARVELDNRDGRWIPGTFVTGSISTSQENLPVVLPRGAVQRVEDRDVVFIDHEGAFEMTPVVTGRSDRDHIEIITGLDQGALYVAEGAFELKATAITSTLGSHAGHGH